MLDTRSFSLRSFLLFALFSLLVGFARDEPEHRTGAGSWRVWGGNLHNTHEAESEHILAPNNVSQLRPKWTFYTAGDVSAIPTVSDGTVYVPDWGAPLLGGGKLHAIDAETGRARWSRSVIGYTGSALNTVSRSSPALSDDLLVFGDVVAAPAAGLNISLGHGATLYAARRDTGELVWKTRLDAHPLSVVTTSPVIYNGVVFAGVSSLEEAASRLSFTCCTFRGSVVALELATGKILWQAFMVPENGGKSGGYAGAAVWGSSPVIDARRGLLYISTGNNYSFPKAIRECVDERRGDPVAQQHDCYTQLDPANYAGSVVALELGTGKVRWAQKFQNYGAWTFACSPELTPFIPNLLGKCDDLDALDFDFGQSPMLYTTRINGVTRDLLGIGQKSGAVYALDPDASGAIVWSMQVGTGAALGGMEFGAATDGERIYVQNTNFDHEEITLVGGAHAGEKVHGGSWSALDASNGKILWQTPDPSSNRSQIGLYVSPSYGPFKGPGFFAVTMGPMTVANGVVYAGSMDPEGHMYAIDGKSGEILWSFASGGSVMSAPSVVDGVLYWGSGYYQGTNSNRLYAFSLPR
jgi:polyvinyl alcohol dehydrogenase (cytochrome)